MKFSRVLEALATGAMGALVVLYAEYAGTDAMLRYQKNTRGNESAIQLARRIDESIDTWPEKILLIGARAQPSIMS